MKCREQGSYARGVYPTQYTSSMGTASAKKEVGAGVIAYNSNRVVRNLEERNVGTRGKGLKQGLISAKDLILQLPEGCST